MKNSVRSGMLSDSRKARAESEITASNVAKTPADVLKLGISTSGKVGKP